MFWPELPWLVPMGTWTVLKVLESPIPEVLKFHWAGIGPDMTRLPIWGDMIQLLFRVIQLPGTALCLGIGHQLRPDRLGLPCQGSQHLFAGCLPRFSQDPRRFCILPLLLLTWALCPWLFLLPCIAAAARGTTSWEWQTIQLWVHSEKHVLVEGNTSTKSNKKPLLSFLRHWLHCAGMSSICTAPSTTPRHSGNGDSSTQ